MTKEQIEKLMQGAFYLKRPLRPVNRLDGKFAVYHYEADATWDEGVAVPELSQEGDAIFCAALPDIAKTCLDLFARVEELEKELKDSRDIAQVWCDRCYALGYDPMKTP